MKKNKLILILFVCLANLLQAQTIQSLSIIDVPSITSKKMGPYIGFQKGKYNLVEFGGEFQYKKIKLTHPKVHGFRLGTNYDFKENVLGFDAGYWYQKSRLGLTYGALICYRTNFDHERFGISPVVGFRFLQFHLQTGYTFYTAASDFTNYNQFFVALKFTLINNRKLKVNK